MLRHPLLSSMEQVSMEAIDHQFNRDDIEELVKAVAKARETRFTQSSVDLSGMAELIQRITKLKVIINVTQDVNAAVIFPKALKNHPFYTEWMRVFEQTDGVDPHKQELYLKKHGNFPFRVDLRTGYVEGAPTEYNHVMNLGVGLFGKNNTFRLTSEELAAIILHELGHLVTFYEWGYRQSCTNFLLAAVCETIFAEKDKDARLNFIYKVQEETGHLRGLEKTLSELDDVEKMRAIVYSSEQQRARSDLGENIYDIRSWEALADQYVTRMGKGKALASGLSRLDAAYSAETRSRWATFASASLTVIGYLATTWFTGLIVGLTVAFAPVFLPLAVVNFIWVQFDFYMTAFSSDPNAKKYDTDMKRIQVIRKELVSRLKSAPDRETKKVVMDEIKMIDVILKDYRQELAMGRAVLSVVTPTGRKQYRQKKTQQLLEELANSELLVSAELLEA